MDSHTECMLRDLVQSNLYQMSYDEYASIAECLKSQGPCNFLSFSTGRDVPLWLNINHAGYNVFLEHDARWIESTREANPNATIYHVQYTTQIDRETSYTDHDIPDFPYELNAVDWDVVFVDGPPGYAPHLPGRFQSIGQAANLGAKHVFVHDCDRIVEQRCCDSMLAPKYAHMEQIGKLRHYY